MWIAITRPVSPSIGRCELTHIERAPIDVAKAAAEHRAYEKLLQSLGARIQRAAAAEKLPDAVFVEDIALVLDEVAVMTRPGAASRRAESPGIAAALKNYRPLLRLKAPATLDGGDVLRAGKTLYVGRSSRTNATGLRQLRQLVEPRGYRVIAVDIDGCLHLKSAATLIADDLVLVNPQWVPKGAFRGLHRLAVDPREPLAANALRLGNGLIYPAHFSRTRTLLEKRGLQVHTVECRELAKAEGAVTCCSIIFDEPVLRKGEPSSQKH